MVDDPETYPMPAGRHTFEYLHEQAHLRVRTNAFRRWRATLLANAVHRHFHENDFTGSYADRDRHRGGAGDVCVSTLIWKTSSRRRAH